MSGVESLRSKLEASLSSELSGELDAPHEGRKVETLLSLWNDFRVALRKEHSVQERKEREDDDEEDDDEEEEEKDERIREVVEVRKRKGKEGTATDKTTTSIMDWEKKSPSSKRSPSRSKVSPSWDALMNEPRKKAQTKLPSPLLRFRHTARGRDGEPRIMEKKGNDERSQGEHPPPLVEEDVQQKEGKEASTKLAMPSPSRHHLAPFKAEMPIIDARYLQRIFPEEKIIALRNFLLDLTDAEMRNLPEGYLRELISLSATISMRARGMQ